MTSKVDGLYHTGLAVGGFRAVALQVAGYLCKGLCKQLSRREAALVVTSCQGELLS